MSYMDEWVTAIERTERFGLRLPSMEPDPGKRWLDEETQFQLPHVMKKYFPNMNVEHLVCQCLSIHHILLPVIEDWLGCPVTYTLGWIDDGTETGMFQFDEAFIENCLRTPVPPGSVVNMHAWLTLPSMEVIDVTLPTSYGKVQNRPEMYGLLISKHADDMKGMKYKPMLVGDEFLPKAGFAIEL